jgi:hypothetical protein
MWDEERWGEKKRRRGRTDNMKQGNHAGNEEVNKEEQTPKREKG